MRYIVTFLSLVLCYTWIALLNRPLGEVPPLGKFFGPVKGFWHNAVNLSKETGEEVKLPMGALKNVVKLSFDNRLVPHIVANNLNDVYVAQGYIHAYYRLFQMEMLVRASSGQLSEIVGDKALNYDRTQRRKGILFGAEQSLRMMESNPDTKLILDAYTRGVNERISELRFMDYPVEYKMLDIKPIQWTNLNTAIILKYMADQLTGTSDDLELTVLRNLLSETEIDFFFSDQNKYSAPVIPSGTAFTHSLSNALKPSGHLWSQINLPKDTVSQQNLLKNQASKEEQKAKGSNNWVIGGKLTDSRAPILANDPHLELSLPSLWYENQLTSDDLNCYGVSIPGAPGIIIGFNDSIAWGVTNNARDVLDHFEIEEAQDRRFYILDGKEVPFNYKIEHIKLKNADDFVDTIRYTIHGPLRYEPNFPDLYKSGKCIAISWAAHQPSNELFSFFLLNRAHNYTAFVDAIQYFHSPAQNFIYADRQGNIALWGQGQFVNKWKSQGKYVMQGNTSKTLWNDKIPTKDNPHVLNPSAGYLFSANQTITDATYPYWYRGYGFKEFRARTIDQFLSQAALDSNCRLTVQDMMDLQNQNYSFLASRVIPIVEPILGNKAFDHTNATGNLRFSYLPEDQFATKFQLFWQLLYKQIWANKFREYAPVLLPSEDVTLQVLTDYIKDSTNYVALNDLIQNDFETLVKSAYKQANDSLKVLQDANNADWYLVKGTSINHLTKLPAFSYKNVKTGGDPNTINSMRKTVGPSWRMVVEMGAEIKAYGVYPGGQSGNPASRYYDNGIKLWVEGKYYTLNFIPKK